MVRGLVNALGRPGRRHSEAANTEARERGAPAEANIIQRVRITALAENTVLGGGLLGEHGLSLLIEADGRRVLFDTGQGKVWLRNARRLGVDRQELDAVVLSHGHYDHTGGLAQVLAHARAAPVFLHPAAIQPKYARMEEPPHRRIGLPGSSLRALRAHAAGVVWSQGPVEVCPGLHVTGEIPRRTGFEDAGGPFFLDQECTRPDPLQDDQALWVASRAGLVVVLGCAHAGVINTLRHVARLAGKRQVHAVLGGMHLGRASAERIERTIQALEEFRVQVVAPCHCSGWEAVTRLRHRCGARVREFVTGSALEFGQPSSATDQGASA